MDNVKNTEMINKVIDPDLGRRDPESVKVAPTLARWGSHHGLIWICRPGGDFMRAGFRLPERIFSAA